MDLTPETLFALGRPLSPLYSMAMGLRSLLYRHGLFRSHRLPVQVVSVGNLTLGGTGKTPMVLHLAKLLAEHGKKPAVISRGYGGQAREPVNVVSDGHALLLPASMAGDEPRLLAENLPKLPVLTGRERVVACQAALDRFGSDCLLLDDGFQHLACRRDLDLVLFQSDSLLGNQRVFPGGPLREPMSALARAHAFVITGVDETTRDPALAFQSFLQQNFPGRPVFTAGYRKEALLQLVDRQTVPVSFSESGPLFAFCGLAKPESFHHTLMAEGLNVAGFKSFQDHHFYTASDLAHLEDLARQAGAVGLVTSEKDAVKLIGEGRVSIPLYYLKVSLSVQEGFDAFVIQRLFG
jgi:tetraacyldisaccharide 4'-kinase